MKRVGLLLGFAALSSSVPSALQAQGTVGVRFETPAFQVDVGATLPLSVFLDPVPAGGLFSYGVTLTYDPALGRIRRIEVPAALNYFGAQGSGALQVLESGSASVKGNVSIGLPVNYHTDSLLATFIYEDLGVGVSAGQNLRLGIYRTLGEAESVFVSGAGTVLDANLIFGTASIGVIPEPTPWTLLVTTAGVVWVRGKFRRVA